jgi:hypothetical protein
VHVVGALKGESKKYKSERRNWQHVGWTSGGFMTTRQWTSVFIKRRTSWQAPRRSVTVCPDRGSEFADSVQTCCSQLPPRVRHTSAVSCEKICTVSSARSNASLDASSRLFAFQSAFRTHFSSPRARYMPRPSLHPWCDHLIIPVNCTDYASLNYTVFFTLPTSRPS